MRTKSCGMRVLVGLVMLAAMLASGRGAWGSSVPLLTPEQTLARAEGIVLVRVRSATPSWTGAAGASAIRTRYVFDVERVIADEGGLVSRKMKGAEFALEFFGGTIGAESQMAHGVPTFAVGERVVLMMNAAGERGVSPLVGWWQSVYRVRGNGADEVVVRDASCCGGQRPVDRAFFGEQRVRGFDAAGFVRELERAHPIARGRAELRMEHEPSFNPAPSQGVRGAALGQCVVNSATKAEWVRKAASTPAVVDRGEGRIEPIGGATREVFGTVEVDASPRTRYGFLAGVQNRPIVFNTPPAMGAFADNFRDAMGYWNLYAPNLFQYYANSNNEVGWPNSRNEVGFLNDAQITDLYDDTWNGAYGVCYSRTSSGRIVETDIAFNSALVWTLDPQVGRTTTDRYFFTVAVHELGHAFGLQHQWDSNPGATWLSVMNYYPASLTYNVCWIMADDALAVTTAYGYSLFTDDIGVYMFANTGGRTGGNPNTNSITEAITPAAVTRGTALSIGNVSIENSGTTAGTRTINWWLTPENGNFNGGIYLGSTTTPNVPGNRSARVTASPVVPGTTTPGAYFLAAQFTVNDDYNFNNTAWTRQTVQVNAAAPSNDFIAGAVAISPTGGTYVGTTFGATNTFLQTCGGVGAYPDVWYRITPQFNGALLVETCGSAYDTVVSVYDGALSTVLACNDDAGPGSSCNGSRNSYVRINTVTSGSTYYIRVGGFLGATGDFALSVRVEPANDTWCVIGPLGLQSPSAAIGTGTVFGTTIGATPTPSGTFPVCNPNSLVGPVDIENRADVFYSFTAPCNGTVFVEGSSAGQMWLAVYRTGACTFFSPPVLHACDGPYTGNIFSPGMSFTTTAGTRYLIRVRMVDTPSNFSLTVRPGTSDDACTGWFGSTPPAVTVDSSAPTSLTVDTRCATPSAGLLNPDGCGDVGAYEPGNDVWYALNIASSGTLNVTRCFGTYLPSVTLYAACSDNPFFPGQSTALACGYSDSQLCDPVIISYPVTAGQTLIVRIAGKPGSALGVSGVTTVQFEIAPLASGACCDPLGACAVSDASACVGTYQGDDTVCDPNPCPAPIGACCMSTVCSLATEADCGAGVWLGVGIPCQNEPGNPITCCFANVDAAGGLTVQDIFDYLALYFNQDPRGDFNRDGNISVGDIFDFLGAYFAGCA